MNWIEYYKLYCDVWLSYKRTLSLRRSIDLFAEKTCPWHWRKIKAKDFSDTPDHRWSELKSILESLEKQACRSHLEPVIKKLLREIGKGMVELPVVTEMKTIATGIDCDHSAKLGLTGPLSILHHPVMGSDVGLLVADLQHSIANCGDDLPHLFFIRTGDGSLHPTAIACACCSVGYHDRENCVAQVAEDNGLRVIIIRNHDKEPWGNIHLDSPYDQPWLEQYWRYEAG